VLIEFPASAYRAGQTRVFSKEPALDWAPDALALALVGSPVVVTDWTTPWALVTVVVTVPLGLSTVVVVVALDEPEPPPPPALGADAAVPVVPTSGADDAPPTPLIALMPLILEPFSKAPRIILTPGL
jgi:hypothetical protein